MLISVAAAGQAPSVAVPHERLQLSDVVREALANNPAIAGAAHVRAAYSKRIPIARALPDPTLTTGWMGSAVPFKTMEGDPSSYRGVTAMQMLPWPGKRTAAASVAEKDAAIAGADQQPTIRRVIADVKAAYYDYFYYGKALEITNTNKAHLEQFADVSEARYRVGKATQQDVLRAQVELSMLLQRTVTLEQQRDVAAARLNTLMGHAPDEPLGPAVEPAAEALPQLSSLLPLAQSSPDVAREDRAIERSKAAEQLARKEYRPEFGVGYMYQQRPGMPDMHGMTFTVGIPIFSGKKTEEAVAAAREETIAAEKNRTDQLNETRFDLQRQYLAAQAAKRMLDLYDKAVIPQTSLALESSESSYQVGSVDFLTMLSNFTTLNSYQIDYYRQLADYATALARIEAITGELPVAGNELVPSAAKEAWAGRPAEPQQGAK